MKNPYTVLKLSQNAGKEEIHKALITAQKENAKNKMYTLKELMEAEKQLLKPEKRLVADFMFPSKFKTKRPKLIKINIEIDNSLILDSIDEEAFDSLRNTIEL